mgnify:CR=1 FL=1
MQPIHRQLYEQAINEYAESTKLIPVNEISVQDAWVKWTTNDGVEHLEYSNSKEDYNELRRQIHIDRLEALSVQKNIKIIADRIIELESNANFYMLYEEVKETLSPSMDIQISSNFERYLFDLAGKSSIQLQLWMDEFERSGELKIDSYLHQKSHKDFSSARVEDKEILSTISKFYQKYAEDRLDNVYKTVEINKGVEVKTPLLLAYNVSVFTVTL